MTTAVIPYGRLVAPHRALAARGGGAIARVRWLHVAVLVAVLPMFGQSFHYIKSIPALWAASKLFPIASLPLALILFTGQRPLASRQILSSFVWLLIVPTFIATVTFQQTFFVGLAAQTKLLPVLYFFSFLGLLRWLRPTLAEITAAFLIVAVATFVVLLLIWLLTPQSAYLTHYVAGDAPLLGSDSRGKRIRMPMYFGLIGIFYCYRRFLGSPKVGWLAMAAAGFAMIFLLVKMRSMVLGVAAIAAIDAFAAATPSIRIMLAALMPFVGAALFSVPYVASVFSTDRSFAFDVRMTTTAKAVDFLGTDPFAWIFGVGTISPMDPAGMMTYFNHFFFLADITWVGVLFEYGAIGALLVLAIPLRGLMLMRAARASADDPLLAALQDYLLYAIVISEMFPMTMAPGELTVIMAIAVYAISDRAASASKTTR